MQECKTEAATEMASQSGLEPPTFPLGGGCSIQLSYWDITGDGRHGNGSIDICHAPKQNMKPPKKLTAGGLTVIC